jgi:hypothetical protein
MTDALDLDRIASKVESGETLTTDDTEGLVATTNLIGLGALADARRRRLHGDRVTFVRVAELSVASGPTQGPGDVPPAAGEVRIVGEPPSREAASEVTRRVVGIASGAPVTGFALDQLAKVCDDDPQSLGHLLSDLKQAGLDMISEARLEQARVAEWLEVADATGLDVAALTVGEFDGGDGLRLIRLAAGLKPSVANVRAFDPLPRASGPRVSTGYADTRQVALARLLVDNVDSIQVDWAGYGPKLAQVALAFGADDVDAVSPADNADKGSRRTPLKEITRNIRAAGFVPALRDGCFETREQ